MHKTCASPFEKTSTVPNMGKLAVTVARSEHVEKGVTLGPSPDLLFRFGTWAQGLLLAPWEQRSPSTLNKSRVNELKSRAINNDGMR